jgi:hypothetical protein
MSDTRESRDDRETMSDAEEKKKPNITLPGKVQKIIKTPGDSEKAEIAIDGADDLYKEIRIDNTLKDADGNKVRLKQGADIDVTLEAPPDGVEKKSA